jgi:NADH-quinone oxidoreductase subunit N
LEGDALQSVLLYLVLYVTVIIGVFALLLNLRKYGRGSEKIEDLQGLSHDHPTHAFMFTLLLLSLAGIPPLAGFFAKLAVFMAALQAKLYELAIFGALTSIISASYYLRLIKVMYFDPPDKEKPSFMFDNSHHKETTLVLFIMVILHTFFFIYPDLITAPIRSMADFLQVRQN